MIAISRCVKIIMRLASLRDPPIDSYARFEFKMMGGNALFTSEDWTPTFPTCLSRTCCGLSPFCDFACDVMHLFTLSYWKWFLFMMSLLAANISAKDDLTAIFAWTP